MFILNKDTMFNKLILTRMKKLQRLKLTQVNNVKLRQDEMTHLIGAQSCGCGCNGPSATYENANANWNAGYSQSGGGNKVCGYWNDNSQWISNF